MKDYYNYRRSLLFNFLAAMFFVSPAFGGLNFPTAINVDKLIHFQKPDGEPVQLTPGLYEVEQGGETVLNLTAVGTVVNSPVSVQAIPAGHEEELAEASADFMPSPDNNPDKRHLLLSLPDGLALEAVGSYSGVFTRSATTWSTKISDEESVDAQDPLTLDIDKAIYFKTVGSDPKAVQPGSYEVTRDDVGLILSPVGDTKGETINIETESLGTSAAVMLPEFNDNPDLELLMLGTAGGQSLVAIGSHSGAFPRGWFKKLKRGVRKVGGKIKKGARKVGSGINRGASFAHGKVNRHVLRHVKTGARVGYRYAKKYGRKVAVAHYKVAKKVGKETVKFCTKSVSNAHTCYKVGKTIASAAAS